MSLSAGVSHAGAVGRVMNCFRRLSHIVLREQPQARWPAMLDRAVHIVCALVCVVILGVFLYNYERGVL